MTSITFSHRYTKFPLNVRNGSNVKLIDVILSRFESLSSEFIEYDCKKYCGGYYNLPKSGPCLILLFLGEGSMKGMDVLFTTVRSNNPSKKRYYRSLIGKELKVILKEHSSI